MCNLGQQMHPPNPPSGGWECPNRPRDIYHLCLIDTTYVMLWCPKYYYLGLFISLQDARNNLNLSSLVFKRAQFTFKTEIEPFTFEISCLKVSLL